MNKILSKIRTLIKRGLITLDRKDSKGQCSYMQTPDEYEAIKPLGFDSRPLQSKKSLVILFNMNGNESNKIGFEYDNKNLFKSETLENGETVIYNISNQNSYLIFKNDGLAKLKGNKVVIGKSGAELLDLASQLCTETSSLAEKTSVHIHASVMGPTGQPNNSADMVTIKDNIDTIKGLIDSIKGSF